MIEDSFSGRGFSDLRPDRNSRPCRSIDVAAGAIGPVNWSGSHIDSPASRSRGPIPTRGGVPLSVETETVKGISPGLTDQQIRRLEPFGSRERVATGTVLFDEGDRGIDFFVVLAGAVEICHYSDAGMKRVVRHGPVLSWETHRR